MKTVFVAGAGPAGLFAAQKIAQAGHEVIVLNRDIKPGGLAEYGIYPTKDKMKTGLRKQFAKVFSLPNVHYLGHVSVRNGGDITIPELREFSPSAMVFAVGAQGTKKLGLPGEDARGVYAAKDFVYYYNQLPPYASQDFSVGRRVAIVGMGNVMVDLVHWLLIDDPNKTVEEVIVVARRGPFEAKFDAKEFAYVEKFLDVAAFQDELKRIQPKLSAVGQDCAKVAGDTFPVLNKQAEQAERGRLRFRFLCSPQSIHADASGRIDRLTVTENVLVERDGRIGCKATDLTADLEVDTMIFAIGDTADPGVGLPWHNDTYVTNPHAADAAHASYEIFDPQASQVVEGTYAVGWARKASEGLVGIARHDGEVGAGEVLKYLETAPERSSISPQELLARLERRGVRVVGKSDVDLLARAEELEAKARGLAWFKFSQDEKMLAAIEKQKGQGAAV
ncbi:MAG TPA: FAD-dependent oxidoreductase [Candidatus Angelobacter sp.]|nr:FAD-dependent oxidoreductase [Candidatus Angelobacter sp.]